MIRQPGRPINPPRTPSRRASRGSPASREGAGRAAVAYARNALEPAPRSNLLGGRLDRRGVRPPGWAWDGTRVVWSQTAMLTPWPAEVLDRRAGEVAAVLGVDAGTADELRRVLAALPGPRLVRAFRRFDRDAFYALAEALVRIEPAVPDAFLLVSTGRSGPAAYASIGLATPGVTGPVSWLLGAAMEVLANNHFGRVWRAAARPECRGNWRCFQAAQVFDILYQKWLVLHELADWGYHHPHLAGRSGG